MDNLIKTQSRLTMSAVARSDFNQIAPVDSCLLLLINKQNRLVFSLLIPSVFVSFADICKSLTENNTLLRMHAYSRLAPHVDN